MTSASNQGLPIFDEAHRKIFEAMRGMNAEGDPIDVIRMVARLRTRGEPDAVGGLNCLGKLATTVGLVVNSSWYASLVASKAKQRRRMEALRDAFEAASFARDDDEQAVNNVRERLDRIESRGVSRSGSESLTTTASTLAGKFVGKLKTGGMQTLVPQSDALDEAKLGPGLITVIGAPPGFGRTALAMQIVFDGLRLMPDLVLTIANAETNFDGLVRRELSRVTRTSGKRIVSAHYSNETSRN